MDVKEAISLARNYVKEVFAEEQISAVGLEEVEFDESRDNWHVTIGFTRPWDRAVTKLQFALDEVPPLLRTYKQLTISDQTAKVLSVKNRERSDA